jgi:hypothetical protein
MSAKRALSSSWEKLYALPAGRVNSHAGVATAPDGDKFHSDASGVLCFAKLETRVEAATDARRWPGAVLGCLPPLACLPIVLIHRVQSPAEVVHVTAYASTVSLARRLVTFTVPDGQGEVATVAR